MRFWKTVSNSLRQFGSHIVHARGTLATFSFTIRYLQSNLRRVPLKNAFSLTHNNGDSLAIFQKYSNKSLWPPQPPAVYRKPAPPPAAAKFDTWWCQTEQHQASKFGSSPMLMLNLSLESLQCNAWHFL
jgi:hypothetical protein